MDSVTREQRGGVMVIFVTCNNNKHHTLSFSFVSGSDRVYQHPLNGGQELEETESCFAFTPSDDHIDSLPNASINDDIEPGQFDDAD